MFTFLDPSATTSDDYTLVRAAFFHNLTSASVRIPHRMGAGPRGHLRLDALQALRAASVMSFPGSAAFRAFVAALRAGEIKHTPDTAGPVSVRNEREALRAVVGLVHRGDEAALIARDRELLAAPRSPPLAADVRLAIQVRLAARVGNQHVVGRALDVWRPLLELEQAAFLALLRL